MPETLGLPMPTNDKDVSGTLAATTPPVQIGAKVFVPRAWSYGDNRVPCPVCYGKLFVILELGNGERQAVECDGCGLGFEGAQGTINEPCAGSRVDAVTVTGFRLIGDQWRILAGDHGEIRWGVEAFATEAEAEIERERLFAEEVKTAADRAYSMAQHKRKRVTWHVYYHRNGLKKAQKDVEYHTRKLSDALARQRVSALTPSGGPQT